LSGDDDSKTKDELLAEIEALKGELRRLSGEAGATAAAGDPSPSGAEAPVLASRVTRRESLVGWVTPVILSMPVVQGVGMVAWPGTAEADRCIAAPTAAPTAGATAKPTAVPTPLPTVMKKAKPTASPTSSPTVSPTLGLASVPDRRTFLDFIVLGGARAQCRERLAA
jgi:hypothetical protein